MNDKPMIKAANGSPEFHPKSTGLTTASDHDSPVSTWNIV